MPIALISAAVVATIYFTLRPARFDGLRLNSVTVSLFSLVALLVFRVVDLDTLRFGVFGNGQLVPWEIIVIFFTAAYASISADLTGLFDYLAYKIVRAAKGSGWLLFISFYLFACALTVFTSNDIVILTLTPIIFYLGKHANIHVVPLLFAEYFGANTSSMLLYIGNPTNIIIGNALSLGFLSFTGVMWLPALVATVGNAALLSAVFRGRVTRQFVLKEESSFDVGNWPDAIVSAALLLGLLLALLLSEHFGWSIWSVTTAFCCIFFVKDALVGMASGQNRVVEVVRNVPWSILPFVFSFFIFMAGLDRYGVVNAIAAQLSHFSGSLPLTIASFGILSLLLANVLNNQPMTILFSAILTSSAYAVPPLILQGAAYAVVISSNLGANVTLIGALAGLMWSAILRNKGLEISYLEFLKTGALVTPIVFATSLVALYLSLIM